jgi:uncharacterized membrane-anchored protein
MGKKKNAKNKEKKRAKAAKKAEKQLKKARQESKAAEGQKASASSPSVEQRRQMIATAAYFIAEKHGFDPAREDENWREAEVQIDEMLRSAK